MNLRFASTGPLFLCPQMSWGVHVVLYNGAKIPPTHVFIDAQSKKQFVEQDFGTAALALALTSCSSSPMSLLLQVQTVLPRSARTVHILDVKSVFAERFEALVQVTFPFFHGGLTSS